MTIVEQNNLMMMESYTEFFDVSLQLIVFSLTFDTGQLHAMVIAEFGRLVPIGLPIIITKRLNSHDYLGEKIWRMKFLP